VVFERVLGMVEMIEKACDGLCSAVSVHAVLMAFP
jgi:hypothetical protein